MYLRSIEARCTGRDEAQQAGDAASCSAISHNPFRIYHVNDQVRLLWLSTT